MATILERKLETATEQVVAHYGDAVRGVIVVGTAAGKATPTSDLDILLVFDDDFFGDHFEALRTELSSLAAELNAAEPRHELAYWVSKIDHHQTLLPDVSYLRANTPTSLTRLDGWCGLAKHALLSYAATSGRRVYGDFEFPLTPKRAPRTEAPELFLIATRALAKGVGTTNAPDADVRALAANELAKAGLRAIAALLLAEDQTVRLGYSDILRDAYEHLPEQHAEFAALLFEVKSGRGDGVPMDMLLDLFRYCENRLSTVPYLKVGGLTMARAGESFGFDLETVGAMFRDAVQEVADYSRCPSADHNYYLFLYFIRSGNRIVELLDVAGIEDPSVLDYFLPELSVMAVLTAVGPWGMNMVLGRAEREDFRLDLGAPMAARLCRLLWTLNQAYNAPDAYAFGEPCLPLARKLARVRLLLLQLSEVPGVDLPAAIGEVPTGELLNELEWQSKVLKNQFNPHAIHVFGELGLKLYQAGDLDGARRILEPVAGLADKMADFDESMGPAGAAHAAFLRELLSTVVHYYALIFHREGNVERAREEYVKSLDLHPTNKSALADFCTMLLAEDPTIASFELLAERVRLAGDTDEMRKEVAWQYQSRAVEAKKRGAFDEARDWYKRAIDLHPGWAMLRFNLGLLHEARNEPVEAVEAYLAAIDLDPTYVKARNRLADFWRERGEIDKALEVLGETFDRDLATADSYNALGCCAVEQGQIETAVQAFKAAIALDGEHTIAIANLRELLAHRGTPPTLR